MSSTKPSHDDSVAPQHDESFEHDSMHSSKASADSGEELPTALDERHDDTIEHDIEDEGSIASTIDLRRIVHAEVSPPKSLVLIWILMAAELGFDMITTAIAFFSTLGKEKCCGHTIYMGPLPMTTSIPFFLLIMAEITFLGRAILLTLWPSIFEVRRVATHGPDPCESESIDGTKPKDDDNGQIGFEVALAPTMDIDDESSSMVSVSGRSDAAITSYPDDSCYDKNDESSKCTCDDSTHKDSNDAASKSENEVILDEEELATKNPDASMIYIDAPPAFIESRESHHREEPSFVTKALCCFLKWNARMVLKVLNLLTLANPFFGCLIAYILLYQSDKAESFVVLGIESLSIILHFVSVRLEGGLRTWYSKALHSIAVLPFFITVIMVLVFLKKGGMCYSVEKELFWFSGCEVCPDTLEPPIDGMCGNYTIGSFQQEFVDIGSSFTSISGLMDIHKNIANLGSSGDAQDDFCSDDINFCFFTF